MHAGAITAEDVVKRGRERAEAIKAAAAEVRNTTAYTILLDTSKTHCLLIVIRHCSAPLIHVMQPTVLRHALTVMARTESIIS
jgi:hypothetical protein